MSLLRRLSTLRHGLGFGVHSPLAYELITAVLPDQPPYYADTAISRAAPDKRTARIQRMVLRLVARFRPATVCCPTAWRRPVSAADSRVRFVDSPTEADMVVTTRDGGTDIRIGRPGVPDSGPLVLTNESDMTITVYRHGLSPQTINTTL